MNSDWVNEGVGSPPPVGSGRDRGSEGILESRPRARTRVQAKNQAGVVIG
jgi:hypothetical protein